MKLVTEHILMVECVKFVTKLLIIITERVDILLADSLVELFIQLIVQQISQFVGN